MHTRTYITASIIAAFALVPTLALAQQSVSQETVQQQLDQVRQQVDRTCLEYFGRSCDEFEPMPMPEGEGPESDNTEPSPGNLRPDQDSTEPSPDSLRPDQDETEPIPGTLRPDQDDVGKEINSVSPESGSIGETVSLSVDSDVISGDWDLYFGKNAQQPLSEDSISVAYPPADGSSVTITFTVPDVYVAANKCKGTDRLSCTPVQTINKAVTSGTHPVWIESGGEKTNVVPFTVTSNETEPSKDSLRPDQGSTEPSLGTSTGPVKDSTSPQEGNTGTIQQENETAQDERSPERAGTGPTQQSTEPQPAVSTILDQLQQTAQTLSSQLIGQ